MHLEAKAVVVGELVRDGADDERPRHVGVEPRLHVAGPQIDGDGLADADHARAHVVADAGLLAMGDDEILRRGAVREERLGDRLLESLGGERLAVEVEDAVDRLGGAEEVCSGARARLGRDLGAADALELAGRLRAAPRGEHRTVDVEDDALGAQPVGQLERGTPPGRPPR